MGWLSRWRNFFKWKNSYSCPYPWQLSWQRIRWHRARRSSRHQRRRAATKNKLRCFFKGIVGVYLVLLGFLGVYLNTLENKTRSKVIPWTGGTRNRTTASRRRPYAAPPRRIVWRRASWTNRLTFRSCSWPPRPAKPTALRCLCRRTRRPNCARTDRGKPAKDRTGQAWRQHCFGIDCSFSI